MTATANAKARLHSPYNRTVTTHDEWVQRLLANPDDDNLRLVYADWLQARGDPRGELIAVQHAGAKDKEEELLARHGREWLGELGSFEGLLEVEWRLGFVDSVVIGNEYDDDDRSVAEVLDGFLASDASLLLRDLEVGGLENEMTGYEPLVEVLARRRPTPLRRLHLGDSDPYRELAGCPVGDVTPLFAALPGLEQLTLRGTDIILGRVSHDRLRSFAASTNNLSPEATEAVCRAHWPWLERLELWFGAKDSGAESSVYSIIPILDRENIPSVTHLGLCNAEFTDDLCEMLPGARVLPHLRSLDLSKGTLSYDGAMTLLERREVYRHLELLDLSENLIEDELCEELRTLCEKVRIGDQRIEDEFYDQGVACAD